MRDLITLVERLFGTVEEKWFQPATDFYVNPSYQECMGLLAKSRSHELRGAYISGSLYVWDADKMIHKHGVETLHREFGVGNGYAEKQVWIIQGKGGKTVAENDITVLITQKVTGTQRMIFGLVPMEKLPARLANAVVPPKLRQRKVVAETTALMEGGGERWLWKPDGGDGEEVHVPPGGDHANIIKAHPEKFGLTAEEVAPYDMSMTGMTALINMALAKGWVRMNQFKGATFVNAASAKLARAAIKYYDWAQDGLYEVQVDVGPDAAHPVVGFGLNGNEEIKRFIRTGKTGDRWADEQLATIP